MAVQLDCPSCGASVKVRRGVVSVECKYCGSFVMVPAYLAGSPEVSKPSSVQGRSFGRVVLTLIVVSVLLAGGIGVFVYMMVGKTAPAVVEIASNLSLPDKLALEETIVMEFGATGTGSGYFQDPECIAIDSDGYLLVGDRETGRIQLFDNRGNYSRQWFISEGEDVHLRAMSCSGSDTLYMVYNGMLYAHDAFSGELPDSLQHPDGWGFSAVDVAFDGTVLASWYCNRDDIIRFDSQGNMDLLLEEAISGQTGDPELNTLVAAGNLGEFYVFGSFNDAVLIYSSEGRFLDRFGNNDMLTMPSGMAVDPMGRLWVSDFGDLLLFDPSGELLERITLNRSIHDFVISDDMQLFGITVDDTVV
ncbi:MAG: hypothetical protein KAH54_10830 [Candidatus Sabulitectum sp.]|nr:hypothetical protein [Candidatus Sabulitectum sp.]